MVDAGAIGEAFRLANEFACADGGEPPYRLSLLSDSGGSVTSSSTISLSTQKLDTYALADFHALFVACDEVDATIEIGGAVHTWVSQQVGALSRRAQYSNREPDKDNHAPTAFVSDKPAALYPTSVCVGTISSMFNRMEIGHGGDGRKTIA
jgi:hypothetical protein